MGVGVEVGVGVGVSVGVGEGVNVAVAVGVGLGISVVEVGSGEAGSITQADSVRNRMAVTTNRQETTLFIPEALPVQLDEY